MVREFYLSQKTQSFWKVATMVLISSRWTDRAGFSSHFPLHLAM